jgi:acetyltransferase-like isoleucine patch superfamily enzyme
VTVSFSEGEASIVGVKFGRDCRVIRPSNLYGCTLGDNVFIGPFVEIQKDVTIGNRTRIQSHCFLCQLVTIGDDCFVGHGVMFINDLFRSGAPAGRDPTKWLRTYVGNKVSIGSNATILPVKIADLVVVGAGSVVTRDLLVAGTYAGNPAQLLRRL